MAEVAVLGCGPAGLITAHAVALMGHQPRIISKLQKGVMPGAMYLHKPIEGLTGEEPDGEITLKKVGKQQGYALKVYKDSHAPVSWSIWEEGTFPIWNLRKAYETLWKLYHGYIRSGVLDSTSVNHLKRSYPLIFSSIPAPSLCLSHGSHQFKQTKIWVVYDDIFHPPTSPNVMIYNGEVDTPWYRHSSIFGFRSWEYGHDPGPLDKKMKMFVTSTGIKPLSTTCTCHTRSFEGQGAFVRVGRYGRWEKNVLTHHAFEQAKKVLDVVF